MNTLARILVVNTVDGDQSIGPFKNEQTARNYAAQFHAGQTYTTVPAPSTPKPAKFPTDTNPGDIVLHFPAHYEIVKNSGYGNYLVIPASLILQLNLEYPLQKLRVPAIKLLKDTTDAGLKAAKDALELLAYRGYVHTVLGMARNEQGEMAVIRPNLNIAIHPIPKE